MWDTDRQFMSERHPRKGSRARAASPAATPPCRSNLFWTPTVTGDMSEDTNEVRRISVSEARALLDTGRGVLVDVRERSLYDNTHAAGAVSLPLAVIQATQGQVPAGAAPPGRVLILYCA